VLPSNILVVDDDPVALKLMRKALQRITKESRVDLAIDGRSALAFLEREGEFSTAPHPDIVFLDWNLPDHHGSEVLERIRARADSKRLPVFIVSASDAPEDMDTARTLGSDGYIVKDADFGAFTEILRGVVRRYIPPAAA
jgi:DNA-binding response OmpR family regulator